MIGAIRAVIMKFSSRLYRRSMQTRVFGESLYVIEGPTVSFYGAPYPTRMCVARLRGDGLFVHSPIELTEEVKDFVGELGIVRAIVSPNKIHHLSMGPWAEAFPQADLWASPGLPKKRPELKFTGELGDAPPDAWDREIDQLIFAGSKVMEEVVFFHKESKTLILADLIENFDEKTLNWVFRLVAKFAGIVAPDGQAPVDFRMSFRDRDKARSCLDRMLAWNPEHIVMAHGVVLEGKDALRHAFRWLLK